VVLFLDSFIVTENPKSDPSTLPSIQSAVSMRVSFTTLFLLASLLAILSGIRANEQKEDEVEVSRECAGVLLVGGSLAGGGTAFLATGSLLALLGFTSTGVAGGSFAAWWQSSMPMISSGSVFATLQSIAMAGAGSGTVALGGMAGALPAAKFMKQVCAKVDTVEPDSAAAAAVALAVATVEKVDSTKAWASKAKDWFGRTLESIGKSLQTDKEDL
jgi:Interferon-induced 6-16 family